MNEQEYITERLEQQISWYDTKSQDSKKHFQLCYFFDIALSASIPFLTLFVSNYGFVKYFVAFIGTITTIISALSATFKFHKNWIEYRTTAETLKHEKYLYLTKAHPYENSKDRFEKLVQNIESLISTENTNWAYYIQKNLKEGDN